MSQVETGNIQLKLQPVQAADIVQQAIEAVQFKAQQKQVNLKLNLADKLPLVNADQEKTAWVLINFLTNAIKYSPDSGTVAIYVTQKNKWVEFEVTDLGKGIEEKYLPRIFDRYFKVPGSSKTGTGLGLAISKEFIEAQGGSIQVHSEIGTGSSFSFLLNIAG
jgi:signal transduction histidine kinase